jgi:hypothetical protein
LIVSVGIYHRQGRHLFAVRLPARQQVKGDCAWRQLKSFEWNPHLTLKDLLSYGPYYGFVMTRNWLDDYTHLRWPLK